MRHERGSAPFALAREGTGKTRVITPALFAWSLISMGCSGETSTSSSIGLGGDPIAAPTYNYETDGPVVAKLRVTAPETDYMFVRGTIPVPRGMVVEGDPLVPLAVISPPDPTAAITQVNIVSRYPDAADGADVVEVIGLVRRPASATPGTEMEYEVVYSPHEPESFFPGEDVETLLTAPGAVRLIANDPFGHRYESDLFSKLRSRDDDIEELRSGPLMREFRVPEVLVPTDAVHGAQGTLPRMMGVNAFVKLFREENYIAIDLHVHNAFDGKDGSVDWDAVINDLYFDRLNLRLPTGWMVVQADANPFAGEASTVGNMQEVPIIDEIADGSMHLMHRQSQFTRRLIIAREECLTKATVELDRRNLGFCIDGVQANGDALWSWWNEETARFMPTNHRLPDLSSMTSRGAVAAEFEARRAQLADQVRTGAGGGHPVESPNLGWAHPYGVAYGGMTGGERIDQVPGVDVAWSASQDAYKLVELRSRMVTERQPFALMTSKGVPTKIEDHMISMGAPDAWLPFQMTMTFKGNNTYFGFGQSPTFQADYVDAHHKKPFYEDALRSYSPIDLQHLIRYSADLETLAWLGNDSLAKFQLLQTAELFRMTHHEGFSSSGGYVRGSSLKARQLHVAEHPGVGVDYRRSEAWGLHATVAAYAMGDDTLRARYRPWLADIAECVRAGQSSCTGNIMASRINRYENGVYMTRQSFEMSFLVTALESLRTTVFETVDPGMAEMLRDCVVDAAYSSISMPFYDPAYGGLRRVTGVGMSDMSIPDFCQDLPSNAGYGHGHIDNQTPLTVWAYAYELTGDGDFLVKAAESVGSTSNLSAELNLLGPTRLAHSAYMLALTQSLGASH